MTMQQEYIMENLPILILNNNLAMKEKKKHKVNGRYHLNCVKCGSLFWSPDAWKIYCPKCSYSMLDELIILRNEKINN